MITTAPAFRVALLGLFVRPHAVQTSSPEDDLAAPSMVPQSFNRPRPRMVHRTTSVMRFPECACRNTLPSETDMTDGKAGPPPFHQLKERRVFFVDPSCKEAGLPCVGGKKPQALLGARTLLVRRETTLAVSFRRGAETSLGTPPLPVSWWMASRPADRPAVRSHRLLSGQRRRPQVGRGSVGSPDHASPPCHRRYPLLRHRHRRNRGFNPNRFFASRSKAPSSYGLVLPPCHGRESRVNKGQVSARAISHDYYAAIPHAECPLNIEPQSSAMATNPRASVEGRYARPILLPAVCPQRPCVEDTNVSSCKASGPPVPSTKTILRGPPRVLHRAGRLAAVWPLQCIRGRAWAYRHGAEALFPAPAPPSVEVFWLCAWAHSPRVVEGQRQPRAC